jgi:hypothetical protein
VIKQYLIKLYWLLSSQFGLDPWRMLSSLRSLPSFVKDWQAFRRSFSGKMLSVPCLHDRFKEGGTTKGEYFWQDLWVARQIHAAAPDKHVDIGSRVDGFVAHVASFREIEVLDVRPITGIIPGITFRQADLMDETSLPEGTSTRGYCDSLSCLHALEHFGLGRYGDPINPQGYRQGLENMAKLLSPGGLFYLSTPIGKERVEFNANWVFDPRTLLKIATAAGLVLKELTIFDPFNPDLGLQRYDFDEVALSRLASQNYNLGLFTFTKL